jgi:cytochrome P450
MLSLNDVRTIAATYATRGASLLLAEAGDLVVAMETSRYREDPYPLYERIRARGPVYKGLSGTRAVTSHALCAQALKDPRFRIWPSSGKMVGASTNALADTFVMMDGADHGRLRRLAAPGFRPKLLRELRTKIEATTNRLLDRAGSEFDLVSDFAAPLPIEVISDLLGIPAADTASFARYGQIVARALDGLTSPSMLREYHAAVADLRALFVRLMAERRIDPGDDVISLLVAAEADEQLTADELIGTCRLLLIAGFETTVNLIGHMVVLFGSHPEQWELLRAEPERAPGAVEEALRFESPVPALLRFPHEPAWLGNRELPRDAPLVILLGAANRDPELFTNPHRFDITRENAADHLAFGGGVHYCLGAPLSRIEGDVALRALVERMPGLRLVGEPEWRKSSQVRGYLRVPVAG